MKTIFKITFSPKLQNNPHILFNKSPIGTVLLERLAVQKNRVSVTYTGPKIFLNIFTFRDGSNYSNIPILRFGVP